MITHKMVKENLEISVHYYKYIYIQNASQLINSILITHFGMWFYIREAMKHLQYHRRFELIAAVTGLTMKKLVLLLRMFIW